MRKWVNGCDNSFIREDNSIYRAVLDSLYGKIIAYNIETNDCISLVKRC